MQKAEIIRLEHIFGKRCITSAQGEELFKRMAVPILHTYPPIPVVLDFAAVRNVTTDFVSYSVGAFCQYLSREEMDKMIFFCNTTLSKDETIVWVLCNAERQIRDMFHNKIDEIEQEVSSLRYRVLYLEGDTT